MGSRPEPDRSIRIEIEDQPASETEQLIAEGLQAFNDAMAGPAKAQALWVLARDEQGMVQGGLKGRTSRAWLIIERLWLSESLRGRGIGGQLIDQAERIARERGCVGAYVDTFSFQAPGFYMRMGYQEFGRIEGFPPGYASIWLKKTL